LNPSPWLCVLFVRVLPVEVRPKVKKVRIFFSRKRHSNEFCFNWRRESAIMTAIDAIHVLCAHIYERSLPCLPIALEMFDVRPFPL